MAGITTVDGLFSGLDTTSLIESLASIQRRPIALLNRRITERQSALNSYQSLNGQVLGLQALATSLAEGSVFQARRVEMTENPHLMASATSGAALGTYEISVERLAQAHKIASAPLTAADEPLGFSGDFRLKGRTLTLTAGDDLYDLRDAINQAGAGVSAAILSIAEDQYRLVLTGLETGAAAALDLVDSNASGFLAGLGLIGGEAVTKHALTNGLATDALASRLETVGASLGLTVAPAGSILVNGTAVAVDLGQDSLDDLAQRLNSAGVGVTATVISEPVDGATRYRLQIVGDSGSPTLGDAGGVLQTLGLQTRAVAHELQAAQDARLLVDGYAVQRATNQVDDAVDGLVLDLLQQEPGRTVRVTVAANTETAVNSLQQLVNSYNSVLGSVNKGLTFDTETSKGGVFFGDISIINIQASLFRAAMDPVASLGNRWHLPSQLGLNVDKTGLLSLDTGKLRQALTSDPQGVLGLLTTRAACSGAGVEFVSATATTADSGAAGYAVHVTQAATRPTAQSAALSDGLTQAETLTLNGRYTVALQAGESLSSVAARLNAVFQGNGLGLAATVVEDRLQLQSSFYGSQYSFTITSSLDQGAGGTDLGGATSGTAATYTGQDVQGTLNGVAATGYGQWLTASAGAAQGLKLRVTGEALGDRGRVQVSKGLASRLAAQAEQLTDESRGTLTRATGDVAATIAAAQDDIARLEAGVEKRVETLRLKFAVAEGAMAKNSALQQYLTNQLKSLTVDRNA